MSKLFCLKNTYKSKGIMPMIWFRIVRDWEKTDETYYELNIVSVGCWVHGASLYYFLYFNKSLKFSIINIEGKIY